LLDANLDPFSRFAPRRAISVRRKTAGGTFVTPLARRLAGENGIDLARMSGSGPRGRIVAADVEGAIAKGGGRAPPMASGASAAQVKALYQGVEFEEVPLNGMRATIARRLVEAKQTIPHFYLTADVTMDALLKIREEANAGAPKILTSSRSTISSSRPWRSLCSACPPPTRCGPATASCASSIPTSASRSRSTAACSRR
jgi:pyruvate dehydrogenase E2 component (dihydrolipoamide acetyltransferase)